MRIFRYLTLLLVVFGCVNKDEKERSERPGGPLSRVRWPDEVPTFSLKSGNPLTARIGFVTDATNVGVNLDDGGCDWIGASLESSASEVLIFGTPSLADTVKQECRPSVWLTHGEDESIKFEFEVNVFGEYILNWQETPAIDVIHVASGEQFGPLAYLAEEENAQTGIVRYQYVECVGVESKEGFAENGAFLLSGTLSAGITWSSCSIYVRAFIDGDKDSAIQSAIIDLIRTRPEDAASGLGYGRFSLDQTILDCQFGANERYEQAKLLFKEVQETSGSAQKLVEQYRLWLIGGENQSRITFIDFEKGYDNVDAILRNENTVPARWIELPSGPRSDLIVHLSQSDVYHLTCENLLEDGTFPWEEVTTEEGN